MNIRRFAQRFARTFDLRVHDIVEGSPTSIFFVGHRSHRIEVYKNNEKRVLYTWDDGTTYQFASRRTNKELLQDLKTTPVEKALKEDTKSIAPEVGTPKAPKKSTLPAESSKKKPSKIQQARALFLESDLPRAEVQKLFVSEVGLTPGNAASYYSFLKKEKELPEC